MKYVMEVWDEITEKEKKVLVDRGSISFCAESVEGRRNTIKMTTDKFTVHPGKVRIERGEGLNFKNEEANSYIKRMLLFGFSSFIYVIDLKYESITEDRINKVRESLEGCPIDFIVAARVPLPRLTASWIRKLKQLMIPLIMFYVDSKDELIRAPWQRYLEAAFPARTMFLLDQDKIHVSEKEHQLLEQAWEQIVVQWKLNSHLYIPHSHKGLPLLFLKRLGMYPQKGSFDSGSDADYFMYLTEKQNKKPLILPDVIVLKGIIIKSGQTWFLHKASGVELKIIPEQFLPIEDIFHYE
ncbi:hypothetical protein ACM26V_01640 [Salipaludibacillus sp. HK11]|uniref:hypothetical protein n=1 Tax=Salipaludibacillus sp. HK11 TaxID=3394320 RepID=UPI0039FD994A